MELGTKRDSRKQLGKLVQIIWWEKFLKTQKNLTARGWMEQLCIDIFTVRHTGADITADLRPAGWTAHMESEYGLFRSAMFADGPGDGKNPLLAALACRINCICRLFSCFMSVNVLWYWSMWCFSETEHVRAESRLRPWSSRISQDSAGGQVYLIGSTSGVKLGQFLSALKRISA